MWKRKSWNQMEVFVWWMVGLESHRKPSLFTFVTVMMSRKEGVMAEDYDDDEMEKALEAIKS